MTGGTIAKFLIAIGVSVDGAKKAEQEVEGTTEAAEDTDKKGSPKLKAFAAAAKVAFGGVAVAAVAASGAIVAMGGAVFAFANEQTAHMDEIAKGAQKIGLGADEFQRMTQAAEHTGTAMDHLGGGVRKLNADMLAAAQGNGAAFEEKLGRIGLSLEDLDGKTTTQQMGVIGDALNLIADDAERAAMSAQIFGEDAGPGMANFLAAGTAGLQEMSDAAEGVFTDEQLGQAEEFQDAMASVKHLLGGVAGELAVALAPAVMAVADAITEFVHENEILIKQQLPEILTMVLDQGLKLVPVILEVASSFADLVVQAEPLIDAFIDFTSGSLEQSLQGVLTVMNEVLPVVLGIASAISEAAGGASLLAGMSATGGQQNDPNKVDPFASKAGTADVTALRARSQELANAAWAKERKLSAKDIEGFMLRQWKGGQINSLAEGVAAAQEFFDPVLSLAERERQAKLHAPPKAPGSKGGRGGAKKETKAPPKSAFFGDYRDVLMTYAGRGPEESMKALEQLEKGVMPAEHKPETSINITNNITNHLDVDIAVNGAAGPAVTAQEIRAVLKAEYKAVAASTPANIVR